MAVANGFLFLYRAKPQSNLKELLLSPKAQSHQRASLIQEDFFNLCAFVPW
jgi:hypothetical protein